MKEFLSQRKMQACLVGGLVVLLVAGGMVGESVRKDHHERALNDIADHRLFSKVVSTFENSDTEIQYDYVENLNDGRGYTAGRDGFTTGTGDVAAVVGEYTEEVPDNPLVKYMPVFQRIGRGEQDPGSTEGLEGFPAAWKQAAKDSRFRDAQDKVDYEEYYLPSKSVAAKAKVTSRLGRLIFYDTIIQQGGGNDADSLSAVVSETEARMTRKNISESAWLEDFLDVRRHHLQNPEDPENADSRQAWRQSVDRVNVLEGFINQGNLSLQTPLRYKVYGDAFEVIQ
jgi:chitosanase